MQKKSDFGYWLGWYVAFGIVAVIFVFAVWQSPNLRSILCSNDDANCFREWLSASGSWAALIAAIPAAWFVYRQVELQRMQARDTLWLSVKRDQVAAAELRSVAGRLLAEVKRYERKDGMVYTPPAKLRDQMQVVRSALSDANFVWLEKNIAHMWRTSAKKAVADIDQYLTSFEPDFNASQKLVESLVYQSFNISIASARAYLEDCVEVLDKEILFYKTMLERYA